jgi:hypothetical protein
MRQSSALVLALPFVLSLLSACSGETSGAPETGTGGGTDKPIDPGTPMSLTASHADETLLAAVNAELDPELTAASFSARYAPKYVSSLGYDPLAAAGLDLIEGSDLALTAAERSVLAQNGIVISTRRQFPSFVYGYESIYMADLPVYVSTAPTTTSSRWSSSRSWRTTLARCSIACEQGSPPSRTAARARTATSI